MNTSWVRTIRTSLQTLGGILPVLPILIGALGVSTTVGIGAGVVAVAAVLTKIMTIPEIDAWINGKLGKKSEE